MINGTGGWTTYGAGLVCDEARRAIDSAGRESVSMAALHSEAGAKIAKHLGTESAFVTNCAAAAIVIATAAALVLSGADPRLLPTSPPHRRKVLLPKGQALNFSAEVTQMIRMAGAEPLELGAVNSCGPDLVERACQDPEVAAALYVPSFEAFPYGTIPLEEYVKICRSHGIVVIVDAAALPLLDPVVRLGPDLIIASPHKFMGGPTSGLLLGREELVRVCRGLESSLGRPFKCGKESIAGVCAAVEAWADRGEETVHKTWVERAHHAQDRLASLTGLAFEPYYPPAPLQGIHARLRIDESKFGVNARTLARLLLQGDPPVAVNQEEADQGVLVLHFSMLDEPAIDQLAGSLQRVALAAMPQRRSASR